MREAPRPRECYITTRGKKKPPGRIIACMNVPPFVEQRGGLNGLNERATPRMRFAPSEYRRRNPRAVAARNGTKYYTREMSALFARPNATVSI